MSDPNLDDAGKLNVSCEQKDRILGAVNRIRPQLPKTLRDKLNDIEISMIQHIGVEGMFICLNGKSVSAIIAEYGHVFKPTPVVEGQLDGMSFQLHDAPKRKITIDEFGRPVSGWEEAGG